MADEKNKPAKQVEKKEVAREEQKVFDTAHEIVAQARQGVSGENDLAQATNEETPPNLTGIADEFKGLPMRELIAAPLIAAAEAQQRLAGVAWDFYEKIAFKTDDKGKSTGGTRLLEFTVERPVEQAGVMTKIKQEIKAPFIGLVPIPSLLIDRVDVDFQMEVTATNTEKTNTQSEASTSISGGGWWGVTASVSGKVSSSRENTRQTNQTAKYQVHVSASQQPQTEGLSKLMDIMASCIEPMTVE